MDFLMNELTQAMLVSPNLLIDSVTEKFITLPLA